MPTQLYLYNYDTAGYALDDTGTGYNFSDLYSAGVTALSQAAVARDDPATIYVFDFQGQVFGRSSTAGATWTTLTSVPWSASAECVTSLVCHATGDIHLFQRDPLVGPQGIYRSTNAGTSWTRILAIPASDQESRGGGIAMGSTRLWYAESNTPLVGGVLPPSTFLYDIKSSNWDASGIVLHGTIDGGDAGWGVAGGGKLRALDDTFCLAVANTSGRVFKITSAGVITDISPSFVSGEAPWDVAIFDANTYVVAANAASTTDVPVYRTTNGGTTWTLVQTIPSLEGFVERGSPRFVLMDVVPGSTTVGYMYGLAQAPPNDPIQQYVWKTVDAGLTWTSFRNLAALTDGSGNYLDFGFGGVLAAAPPQPRVAISSRLATIVG